MPPQNKMNRNKNDNYGDNYHEMSFFFACNRIRIHSRHMLLGHWRKPLLADRLFEIYFHFRYSILITASKLFISRSTLGAFGMAVGWSMNHVIETAGFWFAQRADDAIVLYERERAKRDGNDRMTIVDYFRLHHSWIQSGDRLECSM